MMNEQEAIAEGLRIFTPRFRREIAFPDLDCQELAIALLYKAGRTYTQISHTLQISKYRVRYSLQKTYIKYSILKNL